MTRGYMRRLDGSDLPEHRYGGKAAGLARAIRAGLAVPEGVACDVDYVARFRSSGGRRIEAVEELMKRMPPSGPFAVRSSAVGEDGLRTSFAGVHQTKLHVSGIMALTEALEEIAKSAHSPRALFYRKTHGIKSAPQMGIVVQRMVRPDVAGVALSTPHWTGAKLTVEAVRGHGSALVDGTVDPTSYSLDENGEIKRIDGEDITSVGIRSGIARAVNLCRMEWGPTNALDIEWAWADSTLYVLQVREVTT